VNSIIKSSGAGQLSDTGQPDGHGAASLPMFIGLGASSWVLYLVIAWLSRDCGYETPVVDRPMLAILGLFTGLFVCYFLALRLSIRLSGDPRLLPVVILFAVCFRGTLLFSEPFQEIDIYRYLWDGNVVQQGISPYRFSPESVRTAQETMTHEDDLGRLVAIRDSQPALSAILERIHFADLPTVYPPVSQAVFALAALTTPAGAELSTHVLVMKSWIVLFDLLSLWVLIGLLGRTGKPVGWSLAYAWCPLVLKEFANSGHLDSIAVFLTLAAIWLFLKACGPSGSADETGELSAAPSFSRSLVAAGLLAMAFGAKFYPVVLTPLFAAYSVRCFGWRKTCCCAVVFLSLAWLVTLPVLPRETGVDDSTGAHIGTFANSGDDLKIPVPIPGNASTTESTERTKSIEPAKPDPSRGLKTFLTRWEMNDLLFLFVVENLRPDDQATDGALPWFVIVPNENRQHLVEVMSRYLDKAPRDVPQWLARLATRSLFVLVALGLAWHAASKSVEAAGELSSSSGEYFLRAAFFTLAWCWLLLPTQNPWYWIWALPLVPFARSRAWLALSGLAMIYYLRFWFEAFWPDRAVLGTGYSGMAFFDYVVTWLEFGPWFVWLIIDSARLRRRVRVLEASSDKSARE
jgi:hypothetical protein